MIANILLFVVVAVAGGLGSSWYMIERGSALTTKRIGPWTAWTAAGRPDADPYTRAHFMRRGMLPVSTALAVTYEAIVDNERERLHSSCEYIIDGAEPPDGRFWTISVFDEQGQLIPNPADRYSYNSATVLRAPGNRLQIALARSARPGNWLPTGGAGRITLVMSVEEIAQSPGEASRTPWQPPEIRRTACR